MKQTAQAKMKSNGKKVKEIKVSNSPSEFNTASLDGEGVFKVGTVEELGIEGLAAALSGILYNPNLPATLRDGIQRALVDTFNQLGEGQKVFIEYEKSPEYIEKLLYASLAEETED